MISSSDILSVSNEWENCYVQLDNNAEKKQKAESGLRTVRFG